MKILLASASGIFDSSFPETSKNNSGFGHMIRALADMLPAEGDEVDILTQSNFTKGRQIGKSRLLKKTYMSLLLHMRWHYICTLFRMLTHNKQRLGMRLRYILYYLNGSYCEYIIKKNSYDIVHINGIGVSAMSLIDACVRTNTPFTITLHGLISFDESVKTDRFSKTFEKRLIEFLVDHPELKVSVISSGIKERMCRYAGVDDIENISVICNPFVPEEK